MRRHTVVVVTPFAGESLSVLERCIKSVEDQDASLMIKHIIVGDGFKIPAETKTSSNRGLVIVNLPINANDGGATPRAVGGVLASSFGADALAFLDVDNTWDAKYLSSSIDAASGHTSAIVVSSRNMVNYENGRKLFIDEIESDGIRFADPNCIVLTGQAVSSSRQWGIGLRENKEWSGNTGSDRVFWSFLKNQSNLRVIHTGEANVNYFTPWLAHYSESDDIPQKCKIMLLEEGCRRSVWVEPTRWDGCRWLFNWL